MIEANGFVRADIWPQLLYIESFDQLTVHKEELVKLNNIGTDVLFAEVCVELLVGPVLEDLLAFVLEETSDFLHARLLFKKFSVLKLRSVLRVVPH